MSGSKAPRSWEALHLENEYVRLTVLPELGGRIYCAIDKTRDYDFFYKNNVIKPAWWASSAHGSPAASSSTGPSTTARAPTCPPSGRSKRRPTGPAPCGAPTSTRSPG
ncbi:DUF5107 domain-containing protein [Tessaracoccus coleopterorum]|uniref:DUF5107 domain-containing protein n=1 Tax=Tessaracoccus coleopterorum TaxID=2714950 RepID=UPI0018D31BAC